MDFLEWVESKIVEYEEKTGQPLPAHNRSVLRDMLTKEDNWWTRFDKDHVAGYDDGEPQTTVDFNHDNQE